MAVAHVSKVVNGAWTVKFHRKSGWSGGLDFDEVQRTDHAPYMGNMVEVAAESGSSQAENVSGTETLHRCGNLAFKWTPTSFAAYANGSVSLPVNVTQVSTGAWSLGSFSYTSRCHFSFPA